MSKLRTITIDPQFLNISKKKNKSQRTNIPLTDIKINSSNIRELLLEKLKQHKKNKKTLKNPFIQLNTMDEQSKAFSNEISHIENVNNENSYDELMKLKQIHEDFRFINCNEQIKLIKGDVKYTIPKYLEENQGLIISLLYLDLDLYEPTKFALELLWDRIPKGGIIVFDNAIMDTWSGEAIALHEILKIGKCKLVKIPYIKQFYLVKE